jgi:hypothetical protein
VVTASVSDITAIIKVRISNLLPDTLHPICQLLKLLILNGIAAGFGESDRPETTKVALFGQGGAAARLRQ